MKNQNHFNKVYQCPTCKGIGAGNPMVSHIMLNKCNGKLSRKLREAKRDNIYVGREEAAVKNTEMLFNQTQISKELTDLQKLKKEINAKIAKLKVTDKSMCKRDKNNNKQIIIDLYKSGAKYKEIVNQTGKNINTVKTIINRLQMDGQLTRRNK